jgi:hypothetical protein
MAAGYYASDGMLHTDTWLQSYRSGASPEVCALGLDADRDGNAGCDDEDCWALCRPYRGAGAVPRERTPDRTPK